MKYFKLILLNLQFVTHSFGPVDSNGRPRSSLVPHDAVQLTRTLIPGVFTTHINTIKIVSGHHFTELKDRGNFNYLIITLCSTGAH